MSNTNIFHKRIRRKLKIEALSPNDQLSKSRKCLSVDSRQDFKAYNHVFKRMMRDKRITNIAVTGEFGVGKSSIIRSADRNTFPRHRSFLYVSLVDFYNIYDYSAGFDKNENEHRTEDATITFQADSQADSEVANPTEAISSLTSTICAKDKDSSEDKRKNSKPKLSPKTKEASKTDAREDFIYCFLNQLRSKYSSVRMRRFIKGTVSLSLTLFIILGLWLYSPSGANGSAPVNDVVSSIATADVAQPEETPAEANGANQTPNNGSNDNTTASPAVPEQNISEYSFKNYINGLSATLLNVPYYLSQLLGRIAGKTDGGVFACTKHECNFYGVSPLYGLFAIMLLYYGVWQVLKLIRLEAKMKELNLKFFDVDAKLSFVSQDLPIEKSCPEIISILKELSGMIKNTVIFDDMDRLGKDVCYSLLTKLREINHILNTRTRKTVRFVYPLNNDIYEISRGTKFFDAVIPVISRVNKTNAGDYLFGLISEMTGIELRNKRKPNACKDDNDLDKDVKEFGDLIGECINDYRSIHQILNELVVLTKRGPKNNNHVYNHDKALFPQLWNRAWVRIKKPFKRLLICVQRIWAWVKHLCCGMELENSSEAQCNKTVLLQNLSFVLYKNLLSEDINNRNVIDELTGQIRGNSPKRTDANSAKTKELEKLILHMDAMNWLKGNEYYSWGDHGLSLVEKTAKELITQKKYSEAKDKITNLIDVFKDTLTPPMLSAKLNYFAGVCNYYISCTEQSTEDNTRKKAFDNFKVAIECYTDECGIELADIHKMLICVSTDEVKDDSILKDAIIEIKKEINESVGNGAEINMGLNAEIPKDGVGITIENAFKPSFIVWEKVSGTAFYICNSAFQTEAALILGNWEKLDKSATYKTFMGELSDLTTEEYKDNKDNIKMYGGAWRLKDGAVKNNGNLMEVDINRDEMLWRPKLTTG